VDDVILTIRGHKVILDADLAHLYGVETKNLNKACRRNMLRFPEDFVFRLTADEVERLRFQNGTSNPGRGGRRYLPYAFTEHGAIMAATVLKSSKAVEMGVFVVRAFVKMREQLMATVALAKRLAEVEKLLLTHDSALRNLYQKIRPLLLPAPSNAEGPPPEPAKTMIGFGVREASARYSPKTRSKKKP
jgi:phage regulator Rha-like protein